MANRTQIQAALQKPYDRLLFAKEVLSPVFGSSFSLSSSLVLASAQPTKTEQTVINTVSIYGNITLEDNTEITCYEILLQPTVRIEQSRVAIQRYVRKLLTAGQAALVNFVSKNKDVWRLTLVAKDSELTLEGIKEKTTHAKRYTYLLGVGETCKTAAERFEILSGERQLNFEALINAFSVEKLSKAFFDEYTLHYLNFCEYLQESAFRKSAFSISIPVNATKEEKDKACKPIRDFTKKLLGRIVFLYFVQKKCWLGASNIEYKDGMTDFIMQLFELSGGDDTFYPNWLTVLFFETLNKERNNDDFKMPNGTKVKVPFLNGGLFDKEEYDEHLLTFKAKLFHNPDNKDVILSKGNSANSRGFLDFLNAFNFTVHEDSPNDQIIAVDPEMLGHIFENLLEDNKDKGAFYTPKEIVHYMCQESLIEYLSTHLSKEYTVYRQIDKKQIEIFGNDARKGQLKMMEQLGDKALNRDDIANIVKHKNISQLTQPQLNRMDKLLDSVKICDPAIGSGAFPMGLLQEIFAIKEVIAYELKNEWKPAAVKENIIQNSIYGVDIEKGAVDIARLRFWLSLVVDEDKPRALPNLDYKIVVGDSLVSKIQIDGHEEIVEIDWNKVSYTSNTKSFIENIQTLLKEIAEKQKKFFKPETKDKKKLHVEIRNLKLELLVNQLSYNREKYLASNVNKGGFAPSASDIKYNTEIKSIKNNFDTLITKLQTLKKETNKSFDHFDWKLDFPEVLNPNLVTDERLRGFDIVIGNPPYVSAVTMSRDESIKILFKKKYPEATGSYDLYILFLLLGTSICSKSGNYSWIIPNKFLIADYAKKTKNSLIKNAGLSHAINVSKFNVFEGIGVYPIIIHGGISNTNSFEEFLLESYSDLKIRKFKKPQQLQIHRTLSDFNIKINSGATGFQAGDLVKMLSEKKIKNSIPFIVSGNVDRYIWTNNSVRYMGTLYQHAYIENSKGAVANSKWNFWLKPKIIIAGMTKEIEAVYSENPVGLGVGIYGIYEFGNLDPYCLTGILNSRYLTYYFTNKFKDKHLAGGYLAINKSTIEQFPIVEISEIAQVKLSWFSKAIHYLKSQKFENVKEQLIPNYFEQIIDGIVYELYFPEVLKKYNREIMTHSGELPEFKDKMDDKIKMDIIKKVFNRLDDKNHPIRTNLFYMSSIPEIKLIEGKNENN